MSTKNNNLLSFGIISQQGIKEVPYPCADATASFNQGDLLYYDTTAHIVKALDTDAHAATFAGVAMQPSKVSSNVDNTASANPVQVAVGSSGVFNFKTTVGETYHFGDAIWIGADAQTITNTVGSNTHSLGKIWLPPGVSAVTGAAGISVGVAVSGAATVI